MPATRTIEPIPSAVHGFLELVSRPWTLHILWVLATDGPTRFGALRRRIGKISPRVLSERLRVLEQNRFIYRDYQPTIPPAVTYGMVNQSNDLKRILTSLDAMAAIWRENGNKERQNQDDEETQVSQDSPSPPAKLA
ncbi:MAG: hypothetical protein NVS1B11_20990 [Terriglobales bacterium]